MGSPGRAEKRGRELEILLASAARLFEQPNPDGIYRAAGDIVKNELGHACLIFVKEIDCWVPKHLPFDEEAAALADRLLGRPPLEMRYPVGSLPFMEEHCRRARVRFDPDSVESVDQLMKVIERMSGVEAVRMILELSGDFFSFIRQPVVEAPLMAEGEVYGSLAIYDPELEEDDIPLADLLAKLVSSAVERKRSEDRAIRSERLQAVSDLATGMARELGGAHSSALSAIDSIIAEHQPETDVRRKLDLARSTVERADEVTRRLHAFAQGKPGHFERTRLTDIVRSALDALRPDLDGDRLEAVFEQTSDPAVEADRAVLAQVVTDLVMNARQAMTGVAGGRLSVIVGGTNLRAFFSVADNGCGMSPQKTRRIFTPFHTSSPDSDGPGLGLSVANSAVAGHGGWICVESAPGVGSTFTVWLPRKDGDETNVLPPPQEGLKSRVLVLDDEADLSRYMGECLSAEGYDVETRQRGEEALALHAGKPFDLIMLDLQMPEMDGFEFLDRLRMMPGRQPEVVVVSGKPLRDLSTELARRGVQRWTQKPFDVDTLIRLAAEALGRKRNLA